MRIIKTSFLFTLAALLNIVFATSDGLPDTYNCTLDAECSSQCCNNNKNYTVIGECVEMDSDDRCSARKALHHIILYCLLSLFLITVVACSFTKLAIDKKEKTRLFDLKAKMKVIDQNRRTESLARANNQAPATFGQQEPLLE